MQFAAPTSLAEAIVSVTPNLVNTIDALGSNVFAEPYSQKSIFSTNGGWRPEMGRNMPLEKIFGLTRSELSEENYSALVSASPANVAYLHVRVDTASGGLSGSCFFLIEMDFEVEFFQRQELELSLWRDFMTFRSGKERSSGAEKAPDSVNPPVPKVQDDRDVKELLNRLLNK